MSTIPAPIAGGGGTPGSYQQEFNKAYYRSKPPSWQTLYNGMTGAPNENLAALSFVDRSKLLNELFQAGAKIHPFIEGGHGMVDPFTIEYMSAVQGWAWVMPGTGLETSTDVMGQGNSLPAPAGAIVNSDNIADYPAYPVPVVPPVPPVSVNKLPNPVGVRITFWSLNGLGDLFRQVVDATGSDGYNVGDVWTGTTAQGYSGQFMKDSEEAGLMVAWKRIQ